MDAPMWWTTHTEDLFSLGACLGRALSSLRGFESIVLGLHLTWRAVDITGRGLVVTVIGVVTQMAGSRHLSLVLKPAAVDSAF